MIQPAKLFENFFDDIAITDSRLANFMQDHINRLTKQNATHAYDELIAQVTPPYIALQTEVDNVDVALGIQKGKTLTVDQVIVNFKKAMSDKEGVIADAIGGRGTPAYLEFYPRGISEYTRATKAQLPTLISRVNKAASAHAIALGAALTTFLQGFYTGWQDSRNAQEAQKGAVSDNRAGRSQARQTAEVAMLVSVHTIAEKFPGDVKQCLSFYSYNLLQAVPTRRQAQVISGSIKGSDTLVALNRSFTPASQLRVLNTSDNASLFIYIAPTPNTAVNGHGSEIKAGKTGNFTAADLGDVANTFLLIKNLNEINSVNYVVQLKN